MKRLAALILIFISGAVQFGAVRAQTITLAPVSSLVYCVGDTLTVNYTTTGAFDGGNVFYAELSDQNGSFANPDTVGSNFNETGTFQIVLSTIGIFRVRVISDTPFIASSGDTTISVLQPPVSTPLLTIGTRRLPASSDSTSGPAVMVGQPAHFFVSTFPPADTVHWTFYDDASVFTGTGDTISVTYPTSGLKSGAVLSVNAAGCGNPQLFSIRVLDCNPAIPQGADIVTGNESSADSSVWIVPGGLDTVGATGFPQTFFIDSGATAFIASEEEWNTFYVLAGGSILPYPPEEGTIIYGLGARDTFITPVLDTLSCADLQFQIPDAVATSVAPPIFRVAQTEDAFTIVCGESEPFHIHILDMLGKEIISRRGIENITIDLSQFDPGVYFAVMQSEDAMQIAKIVVVR